MKIALPPSVKREIADFARRAGRSTGFVARRALAAARKLNDRSISTDSAEAASETLALAVDEEDEPRTLARVGELLAERGGEPGRALAVAWRGTRGQFLAWLQRHEEAERAARADELDAALAEASSSTDGARLAALAEHEYVQVRARVARNRAAPPQVLAKLATERERTIREALRANPSAAR